MDIKVTFRNEYQEQFYNLVERNTCFSGGFNNGKTYAACLKAMRLLGTFPKYRMVFARQYAKDLRETTMRTFFKICPQEFIKTHNNQEGKTILKNDSEILWMHLDEFDEQSLRGLEINSVLLDQAEELSEAIYLVLDSRIGRWDKSIVPQHLLDANPNWPKTALGNYKVPTYMIVLCNPDTQFHWIYQRFHPDSVNRLPNHIMIEAQTDPNLGDIETISQMLNRDEEWVKKYYRGEWGISDAQIHTLNSQSILEPNDELLEQISKRASLFRSLDHGDSAPTCCLWFAALGNIYICYREYYVPNGLISDHRWAINDLSGDEVYSGNYVDPSIFRKAAQKDGAFWSVSDEYITSDIDAPPLSWIAADNNEFATRNRINELIRIYPNVTHPITKQPNAPKLYFIKKTRDYPYGCHYAITELQSQRRKKIGDINGKTLYSDDREISIPDHAYDPTRYFIAMHGVPSKAPRRIPPRRSFAYFDILKKRSMLRPLSNA